MVLSEILKLALINKYTYITVIAIYLTTEMHLEGRESKHFFLVLYIHIVHFVYSSKDASTNSSTDFENVLSKDFEHSSFTRRFSETTGSLDTVSRRDDNIDMATRVSSVPNSFVIANHSHTAFPIDDVSHTASEQEPTNALQETNIAFTYSAYSAYFAVNESNNRVVTSTATYSSKLADVLMSAENMTMASSFGGSVLPSQTVEISESGTTLASKMVLDTNEHIDNWTVNTTPGEMDRNIAEINQETTTFFSQFKRNNTSFSTVTVEDKHKISNSTLVGSHFDNSTISSFTNNGDDWNIMSSTTATFSSANKTGMLDQSTNKTTLTVAVFQEITILKSGWMVSWNEILC